MNAKHNKQFQPRLEALEERSLMAARLTASLADGVLKITGTERADLIQVRQIGNQISVAGFTGRIDASRVRLIVVDGLGGNDRIDLGYGVRINAELHGGAGNDVIIGGAGADKIFGGTGSDRLEGRGGNDSLDGGWYDSAPDYLYGGKGADIFVRGRERVLRLDLAMDLNVQEGDRQLESRS